MRFIKTGYAPGVLLFLIFLLIGIFTNKDHGVAWDEEAQRNIGTLNYNYVFHNDGSLKQSWDRYYGPGFELPLIFIEKNLQLRDSRDITLMRHLMSHIFFLLSAFCGYILFYRLFKDRLLASIGFLFLVLHPRIYAHSFFNTKDIPALSLFLIAFLLIDIAFQKKKTAWYILLGVCCGYLTAIRISGVLLFTGICLCIAIDAFFSWKEKRKIIPHIIHVLSFIIAFTGMLLISYPNLWTKPLENFVEAYQSFAHFRLNTSILFAGKDIYSVDLPYSYIPVWFTITTPPVYILTGVLGFFLIIFSFIRSPKIYLYNPVKRNFLLYILYFLVPILMLMLQHSVLYDDWRHLYFIYPAFILFALFAIKKLFETKAKWLIIMLCVIQISITGIFMIQFHPYQQVYFNSLVSHKNEYLRHNYEMDYWGSSYKQGLEYIALHDTTSGIKIAGTKALVMNNIAALPLLTRKRIMFEPNDDSADYFITNYRYHPNNFPYTEIYHQQVLNSTIMAVYRLK